jgi:hypothetical protein
MLGEKVVVLGENGGDEQVATSKASNQQPGLIWFVGVFLGRVDLHFQCHKKINSSTDPRRARLLVWRGQPGKNSKPW